jgi:hypothetical protein
MSDDYKPTTVKSFVQFLYTGDYLVKSVSSDTVPNSGSNSQGKQLNAEPNRCANILPRAVPVQCQADQITTDVVLESREDSDFLLHLIHVNSIADYYGVKDLIDLSKAKIAGRPQARRNNSLIAKFPSAVKEAYETTGDQAVPKLLAVIAARHLEAFLRADEFNDVPKDFLVEVLRVCSGALVIRDVQEVAQLEKKLLRRIETWENSIKCNNCGNSDETKFVLNHIGCLFCCQICGTRIRPLDK